MPALPVADARRLVAIAQKVGTPFWLYDAAIIRDRLAALKAFDTVRYAQKANSNLNILRLLRSDGAKVDAVSLGEVERALAAGFSNEGGRDDIVFTADLLEEATLTRLIAQHIPINCGSPDMIRQIGERAKGHPVWLRINPGFGHGHSRKTNTGGPSSKHGIWYEEFEAAVRMVADYGLMLVGLHMHIGSGVDYSHLEQVADSMIDYALGLPMPIAAISAGGGLSTPYQEGDPSVDTAHYFSIWDRARNEIAGKLGRPIRLEIEPGRYLVAESGLLVAEVRAVKTVADRVFVLVNAGFSDLMRPAMYGSHHGISFLTPDGAPVEGEHASVVVAGPLCESGDVFTQAEGGEVVPRRMAVPKIGDLAVFHNAGAYGASMSSNYNSRPLAAEVMVEGGQASLIRTRQSLADLLALEEKTVGLQL